MSFNLKAAEQYRVKLGLGPRFGESELRKTYYALVKRWHPDKFPNQTPEWADANKQMAAINVAHEFLSEILESNGGCYPTPSTTSQPRRDEPCASADLQPKHTYKGRTYGCGFSDGTVTEIFVRSSHIISAGYDRATRTLYIKVTWGTYRYLDVPESVFEAFLNAPSHGKFRHRHILHHFREELC